MYRFQLDRSPKKYICPSCGERRFVRMIDTTTNQYCADEFGRCDRESSCGYFHRPEQKLPSAKIDQPIRTNIVNASPSTIDKQVYSRSMDLLDKNNFYRWLEQAYGRERAIEACKCYGVGSNPYNPSQTAFWQIDRDGKLRTAELIWYDQSGKRRRDQNPNWIHAVLKHKGEIKEYILSQVAYGVHLLDKHVGGVGVVEGAKTAIVMALEYPKWLWIGTPGVHGLSKELCRSLPPARTILIPDAGFEAVWEKKSNGQFQIMTTKAWLPNGYDLVDHIFNNKLRFK